MPDWPEVVLGDVVESITVGHVGPMATEYVSQGVPFLRSQNIEPHRLDLTDVKYISGEFHAQLKKSALNPGDVVIVRTGKPGTTSVIPESLPVANCSDVVIVHPGGRVDPRWLSYYINSVAAGYVSSRLVGAVQQHFNVGSAREMTLPLPPLPEQRAIAEVLGALDDKIESNRRVVQCVMDLSTALFNQWRLSVTDWTTTTFGEFASVYGGATPKTGNPEFWDGPHCWLTPTDVTHLDSVYLSSSARTITDAGLASASTELHPPGTVLMTSRATIGAFAINQVPCAPNQGFIAVRPAIADQRWFLFHEMRRRVPEMLDRANGTTFREISRGSFKSMELMVPADDHACGPLDEELSPLHERAAQAVSETSVLAATRDTLLPALLSGRIRVPAAAELVEA